MKTRYTVAFSMLVGAVLGTMLGAGAIQGLHAQAKAPAYVISLIEVINQEGLTKEFGPAAVKALAAADPGYKGVARGVPVSIDGALPAQSIAIGAFTDVEHAVAAYNSPDYKAARVNGDKYGKFRIFVVPGVQ